MFAGAALPGQRVHGQLPGTGVLVTVGVAVGGAGVAVLVGVGVVLAVGVVVGVDVGVAVADAVGVEVGVSVGPPGVLLGMGVSVGVGVFVAVEVRVGVPVPVGPSSIMKLSKLVSHPFELPIVTGEQVSLQPVLSTLVWLGATTSCAVGWPAQLALTVLETVPPLNAVTWMRRFGATKVSGALVGPAPLKPTLLVVKAP
jgi:hypothetical protein